MYMCVGRGLPSTLSQGGQSTAVLLGHLLQLQREGPWPDPSVAHLNLYPLGLKDCFFETSLWSA